MDIAVLIEQFGAWAFVALIAGFLLKYVIQDLRKDNDRNYGMAAKLHARLDSTDGKIDLLMRELTYIQGMLRSTGNNGKPKRRK